jgi:hypothetical protein
MKFRSAKQPQVPAARPVLVEDLRLAVPWYLHPAEDPRQWAELIRQAQLGRVAFAVVNVASGPGEAGDPYYPAALAGLREGGVPLHGYVDTDYSARPPREVMDEVIVWRERYGVEGIMFDRVSADPANLSYYLPIAESAREAGIRVLVGNPGVVPHPAYLRAFDVVCVFEDVDAVHQRLTTMAPPVGVPPDRLWHLVHGVHPLQFDAVLARIAAQGAGLAFVTDRTGGNPWCGMPAELVASMDRLGMQARHRSST